MKRISSNIQENKTTKELKIVAVDREEWRSVEVIELI